MKRAIRSGRIKIPEDLDILAFDLVAEIGLQPSEFADWPVERVLIWHVMASERRQMVMEAKRKAAEKGVHL